MSFILIIFIIAFILFFSLVGIIINSISYIINSIVDSFCRIFSIKRKKRKEHSRQFFTFHTNFNKTGYYDNKYNPQSNQQNKNQTYRDYMGENEPRKIFGKNEGDYIPFEEI